MSRRSVLWLAFVAAHLWVIWLGHLLPNEPMGDVYRVYEPWSSQALEGRGIMGVTEPWVYPQLALAPMVLAHVFAPITGYVIGWALVVTLADAAAFAILLGRGRSTGRAQAAWFWLLFLVALGPVGLFRLDGFTVPLAVVACLWLIGRPWIAAMILAAATWIKVWPAALLAAAVIAVRRRGAIIGGAALVTAAMVVTLLVAGAGARLLGFVTEQTARGLQVEAPAATPFVWAALWGNGDYRVEYSFDILTFQVAGSGVAGVVAAMTPVLVFAVVAIAGLGALAALHGARFVRLFPVLSLALVLAFIVCNKVGSPQFHAWLVPSLILGLVIDRRAWMAPALVATGAAAMTQLVYPVLYGGITTPEPLAVTILTLRNLVLVALLAWMLLRLVRLVIPARAAIPMPS